MINNVFYNLRFKRFFNKLKKGNLFYSRFNDGEIRSILNVNGKNCDNHVYYSSMGERLKNVLLEYKYTDNYIISSNKKFYNTISWYKNAIDDLYFSNNNLKLAQTDFNQQLLNYTNFHDFVNILKSKNVVIVGPYYLKDLNLTFDFTFKLVNIPLTNCYLELDNIIKNIKELLIDDIETYVLISASMPAALIIDYFYKIDKLNTFIDMGSSWDRFFQSKKYSFIRQRSKLDHWISNNIQLNNYFL